MIFALGFCCGALVMLACMFTLGLYDDGGDF
jgi:hypothetical protein